jgi:methionine synthase II (cobalamin-independent)
MSTKQHRQPPFRAEHIGSLRRPESLLEKRREVEAGKLSEQDLVPYEDEAIKDIVKTQLDLGFPAVTDGEFRRISFWVCHVLQHG